MSDNIEKNRQNFNIDWRAKQGSYVEQMEHFCMSEEFADINFVFTRNGTITKIPAHKFAIVVASEVFQKEFTYGDKMEVGQESSKTLQIVEIKDENVDVDAFKMALLFIYSGYKKLELTGESVLAILYIAMKYMIKELKARCVDYLLENLNVHNIVPVLQYCLDFVVDQRLVETCREVIRSNIKEVLKAEIIETMNEKCLCFMLDDDELNVAEIELFLAVNSWICKKCPENRSKSRVVLSHIRFQMMSLTEFVSIVVPLDVLSKEEQLDVMLMICGQEPDDPTICNRNWPRKTGKWLKEFTLEDNPYEIATNFYRKETRLQFGIRIENFPSFVKSKADYYKFLIENDVKWFIVFDLNIYCQNEKKYVSVTPSSNDQPETLGAYICGIRNDEKDSSFIVCASFKFKQQSTAEGIRQISGKIDLDKTNDYQEGFGINEMAKIDDLLNEQNGYLVDNSLEMLVDVTISDY